jgi:WD40 repeat protein
MMMRQIASLDGHTGNITALAYSAQGKWVVTGSEDGTVKVWDTRSVAVDPFIRVSLQPLPWTLGETDRT